jgi:pyruvate/2-oxoglutarate dehydrogenase complex dihydrolipoamide dehydrogenase (E3) component
MIDAMTSSGTDNVDVLVIGAGPAGVVAALRAGRLGARTALVTRDALGGMAASDGPVPVRTLAQAARLLREAKQLPTYGITAVEASLDYSRLLDRVREVTSEVAAHSELRGDLDQAGVAVHEQAGGVRFIDPYLVESEHGLRLRADKTIICTGGIPRRLEVPGVDLTSTHSDAWTLSSTPPSMVVIGAGATGVQVASIFNAFGTSVTIVEMAPRILMSEDDDVASALNAALHAMQVRIMENAGTIERFDRLPNGIRTTCSDRGMRTTIDAALVVVAAGWVANTEALHLAAAGVQLDSRGYIEVDSELRTTAPHIFAAGDVTGHVMVVHEAVREAFVAANNAVLGQATVLPPEVSPLGSFTDPEYASVGLTEAAARKTRDIVVATQRFDLLARPIIDGRTTGFCKLIVDRQLHSILGCHIVGERAVELAQLAAIAMASGMKVEQLALVPFSFPTYANALGRAAVKAGRELDLPPGWVPDALADQADVP